MCVCVCIAIYIYHIATKVSRTPRFKTKQLIPTENMGGPKTYKSSVETI